MALCRWMRLLVISIIINYLPGSAFGYLEPSRWTFKVKEQTCHFFQVHRALFKDSLISMRILCNPSTKLPLSVEVGWVVRESPCYEEYLVPDVLMPEYLNWVYDCPFKVFGDFGYDTVKYIKKPDVVLTCDHLIDSHFTNIEKDFITVNVNSVNDTAMARCQTHAQNCGSSPPPPIIFSSFSSSQANQPLIKTSLNKRAVTSRSKGDPESKNSDEQESSNVSENSPSKQSTYNLVRALKDHQIVLPDDGMYLLILRMASVNSSDAKGAKVPSLFDAEIEIEMKTPYGYLSAAEYPLLQFYAVMCIIYVILATIWMVVSALQWKDLLRIQFWIGGVIFLGMLEKAVFYAEYQSVNVTGSSFKGAVLLAETLSCLKRTLARMLVIIVSLGFGIIKPRLGAMFQRVLAVGILYFVLSFLEVLLRVYKNPLVYSAANNQAVMTGVPLALLDSIICWWIFGSLVQTIRTLRLRRNQVKLTLYTQFTNTLVASVITSVLFIIWQVHAHKLTSCLTEWNKLWIDRAFWHMQFSAVLLVIMVLWRPTQNNQRYAFTPMLDGASDDEENELFMSSAYDAFGMYSSLSSLAICSHTSIHTHTPSLSSILYETFSHLKFFPDGMKMRQNSISESNTPHLSNETGTGKSKEYHLSKETEDDLKWVQENLSTSFVEA